MARENAWKKYDEQALCALEEISKKYRGFLNDGKSMVIHCNSSYSIVAIISCVYCKMKYLCSSSEK